MKITANEASRLMDFGLFCFLRQNGYSEENLAEGIEFAKHEFCAFCEAEGIDGI